MNDSHQIYELKSLYCSLKLCYQKIAITILRLIKMAINYKENHHTCMLRSTFFRQTSWLMSRRNGVADIRVAPQLHRRSAAKGTYTRFQVESILSLQIDISLVSLAEQSEAQISRWFCFAVRSGACDKPAMKMNKRFQGKKWLDINTKIVINASVGLINV